jgi:hypothetical protein
MERVVKKDYELFSWQFMSERVAADDNNRRSVGVSARIDIRVATGDAKERRRKFDADDGGEAKFRRDKKGPTLATSEV